MKKFITLLLVVFVGLTFAGCENSKNALANNIETNVNKITKLLENTKEITDDDILIEEWKSFEDEKEINNIDNSLNKNISIDDKISNQEVKNVEVERSSHIKKYDWPKVEKMPRPHADTQIVKNDNELENDTKTVSAKGQTTTYEKMGEKAVNNALSFRKNTNYERLTTGKYIPTRISENNYNNSGLTNYFSRLEDLYLMMNDACGANKDCGCLKSCILENCNMLNQLCKQLRKNEIELTSDQINNCNNCLSELNKHTNILNNTKNDVQTNCNAVKTANVNPNANIEQLSSKYTKLINCLDERIDCYSNILSILTQIKCIITGVCEEDNIEQALEIEENFNDKNEDFPKVMPLPENDKEITLNKNEIKNNENTQKIEEKSIKNEKNKINQKNINKINDFGNKKLEENKSSKNNLDTFKNQTIKPNIDFWKNNKKDNKVEKENVDDNKNDNINAEKVNQNNAIDNLPNNSNTMNNGIYNNGVAVVPGSGVAPGVGINGYPNGVYNNNVISNGYGYHNYENGITNPYRNTDTYKLPIGNGVNNGVYGNGVIPNGIANIQPLESETRKDFKPFAKVA